MYDLYLESYIWHFFTNFWAKGKFLYQSQKRKKYIHIIFFFSVLIWRVERGKDHFAWLIDFDRFLFDYVTGKALPHFCGFPWRFSVFPVQREIASLHCKSITKLHSASLKAKLLSIGCDKVTIKWHTGFGQKCIYVCDTRVLL